MNPEDKELLKKFTEGDRKAFNELHNRYHKAIRGYIVTHVFGSLKKRAEDIEQETWILLWEKHDQFDIQRSFYSFARYWADIMIKRQLNHHPEPISLEDSGDLAVAEEASVPSPSVDRIEAFFKSAFQDGGPPHQVIAFCFNKLLSQWKAGSIVSELGRETLDGLFEVLVGDYRKESLLPQDVVGSLFQPLKEKLQKTVDQVLDERASKESFRPLLNRRCGETKLTDYFGTKPEHNIADWSYKVRTRIMRSLSEKNNL